MVGTQWETIAQVVQSAEAECPVAVDSIAPVLMIVVAATAMMEEAVTASVALAGEMELEVQLVVHVKLSRVAASRATRTLIKYLAAAEESSTTKTQGGHGQVIRSWFLFQN